MSKLRRICILLSSSLGILGLLFLLISFRPPEELPSEKILPSFQNSLHLNRINLLQRKCRKYSNPFRPEKRSLFEDRSLGVEIVHFPTPSGPMSACIPHKTGSMSWGIFSRELAATYKSIDSFEKYSSLNWKEKSAAAYKILVVRHPLERLVSVYRMIFEDWCDPDGIPAKSWHICSSEMFDKGFREDLMKKITGSKAKNSFISFMMDSYRYSNDLYMFKIWESLHPDEYLSTPSQLRFSFVEFVSFLIQGSEDPFVRDHKGVSYHWAPFWKECSLCSELTFPSYIAHLETLRRDLGHLEQVGNVSQGAFLKAFPHVHDQKGTRSLSLEYYKNISKEDLKALLEMYALDIELFGFDVEPYLAVAW